MSFCRRHNQLMVNLLWAGTSWGRRRRMRLQENRLFLLQNLRFDRNHRLEAAKRETCSFFLGFFWLRWSWRCLECRAATTSQLQVRKLTDELLRVSQRNWTFLDRFIWTSWQAILVVSFVNSQHNFVDNFRRFRWTWTQTFLHFFRVQVLKLFIFLQSALILFREMIAESFRVFVNFLALFIKWRHWRRCCGWTGRQRRRYIVLRRRRQIHHQVRLQAISRQDRRLRLIHLN